MSSRGPGKGSGPQEVETVDEIEEARDAVWVLRYEKAHALAAIAQALAMRDIAAALRDIANALHDDDNNPIGAGILSLLETIARNTGAIEEVIN